MKKLLLLTVIAFLSFALLSCNDKTEESPTVTVAPESDFEYEENSDGGITITGYVGKDRFTATDKDVIIPETINGKPVDVIGSGSFKYYYINSVVIPNGVHTIEYDAFAGNSAIKKIVLPETLVTIGNYAFTGCSSLSDITLPESLTSLGGNAFEGCSSLKNIRIPKNLKELPPSGFKESGLETIEIDSELTYIPDFCFSNSKLKEITIHDSVEHIDWQAFSGCEELTSVVFGKGLKKLGYQVFSYCTKLTELVFPKSIEKMYEIQFFGCTNLTSVKFEGNAPEIDPEPEDAYADDGHLIKTAKNEPITIYYHKSAEGFGETWNGYPTDTW